MTQDTPSDSAPPVEKSLTPEAERALAEAAARRKQAEADTKPQPTETGGRGGLDPIRYGDWEKGGLISDF